MLRKIFFILAVFFSANVFAQSQFAIVDFQAVLESLSDYNLVILQLNETSNRYQEEYSKMSADIDKKFEDYQTLNKNNTPESIKQRRIQEIQNMQKRAEQFLATAEEDLKRQENQLIDPIKVRVKDAIRQVGEQNGFVFVFPAEAPLYQSIDVVDITEDVKTLLQNPQ